MMSNCGCNGLSSGTKARGTATATAVGKSVGCGCGGGGGCSCGGSGGVAGGCGCGGSGCLTCEPRAFVRPRFFAGQLLTEEDLALLGNYVVEKNRLHNRSLWGPGVVCGLDV